MSRTKRHDKYTEHQPKTKRSRLSNIKQKYSEFLMIDMWYEELPIIRKSERKARA